MTHRTLLIFAGLCLALASRSLAEDAPKPVAGAAVNPEAGYDKVLQAELLGILEDDQAIRVRLEAIGKEHGYNSPEARTLGPIMLKQDAVNLGKITAILDTRGWVGPELVGAKASSALFYVIQHSDTATQEKYLPMLRAAVKEKKAPAGQLALMEDRVDLAKGRPQTYGSQLMTDPKDGHMFVRPLADPDHVDERRAAMGLSTMAENLKHFGLTWDLEEYKKHPPAMMDIVINH